jgi:Ca2+-binding RTX toxin-like protein
MSAGFILRLSAVVVVALALASVMSAMAATTLVPVSGLDVIGSAIVPDDLPPSSCTRSVSNLIVATGAISGTAANDLILAGPGADTISGGSGDDCILGGGGADLLFGDSGTDTCIGGAGIDVLDLSCETRQQ